MDLVITNRKGELFTVYYDECDSDIINSRKWYVAQGYVRSTAGNKSLHRLILGIEADKKLLGDHINRNTLDNRRSNLRVATFRDNVRNRSKSPNASGKYLGVSVKVCKVKGVSYPYIISRINVNKKIIHLGTFKTYEEAAVAYDKAAKIHYGEFANLNFK